ncbi:MAG: cell division protein FtsA [Kiritimatiellae bacterium]|nr:cell division protein FtsA [Kiritimatiellia bacterium]
MALLDQPPVVALELGTTKVRAVVGMVREDYHLVVLGVGECASRGVRKSEIVDFEAAAQAAREALELAEANSDVGIKQVCLLVSGANLKVLLNCGNIPLTGGGEITRDDIEHVLETARSVNLQGDYEILHSLPQHYTVDEQRGIVRPEGLEGSKLAVEMMIMYAPSTWLRNLIRVAKSASVDVEQVAASGLCAALAVLSPEDKQRGALVIDLGGGSTNYVAYAQESIAAAGSFAVGGDHLTNDLARGLNVTAARAERLKEEFGSAEIDLQNRTQHIEIASEASGRGRYVRLGDLQTITHLRMEETLRLVRDEMERQGLLHYLGRGVVLTGGGAYLKRLPELAERVFNLPCQLGRPKDVSGLALATDGPQYASTIGLLRFASRRSGRRGASKMPDWLRAIWGGR